MSLNESTSENVSTGQVYMLCFDHVGHIVPKSRVKKGIDVVRRLAGDDQAKQFTALRGMLFEALPERDQPDDKHSATLILIDDPTQHLTITLDKIKEIQKTDVDFLRAVPSPSDRYDIVQNKEADLLKCAKSVKLGTTVYVETIHGQKKGTLRYKGRMSKRCGIFFGVELRKPHGDGDGSFNKIEHFKCEPKHGIFVPLSKITFDNQQPYPHLKIGMRVIGFVKRESKDKIIRGVLQYLDEPEAKFGIVAGIILDKKLKSFAERNQISYNGKKKLFKCETEKYFLTFPEGLLPEVHYDQTKGDMAESYEILTQDDAESVNGESKLKHEKIIKVPVSYTDPVQDQERLLRKFKNNKETNSVDNPEGFNSGHREKQNEYSGTENAESKRSVEEYQYHCGEIHSKKEMGICNQSFLDKENKMNYTEQRNGHASLPVNYAEPTGTTGLLGGKDPQMFLMKNKSDKTENEQSSWNNKHENNTPYSDLTERPHSKEFNNSPENKQNSFMSDVYDPSDVRYTRPNECFDKPIPQNKSDSSYSDVLKMVKKQSNDAGRLPLQTPGIYEQSYEKNEQDLYTSPPSYQNIIDSSGKIASTNTYDDTPHYEAIQKAPNMPDHSDPSLQIGSMVQVNVSGTLPLYGVIRWKGIDASFPYLLAGLELEDITSSGTDGTFQGTRYFSCPNGRGFFCKLTNCKPDARFDGRSYSFTKSLVPAEKYIESVEGFIPPPEKLSGKYLGRDKGVQGHHNSCYMDATLFAMFSFSYIFDMLLYRKRRHGDIDEYDIVQKILREQIVNPLRKNGFVNHHSVMELRKYLHNLGNIGGFLNEEKDPEEFVNLLFEKVLKVDPFVKLRHDSRHEESHLYQIFTEKNEDNPLPSIQYLFETSFLTSNLQLLEAPSVMVLQMPRFGMEKLYKRIQITPTLDITPVLSEATHQCVVCSAVATVSCRECSCHYGWDNVFAYYCKSCCETAHQHARRRNHKPPTLLTSNIKSPLMYPSIYQSELPESQPRVLMELFAVVCIKTSHYVSFAKCGMDDEASWVFFDSMADRHGGQNGYNIPEVTELHELKRFLTPAVISSLHSKSDERILRLYEDASLCFYRNNDLTKYK